MKYEYKKMEKDIYGVSTKPILSNIPSQKYICIKGTGAPSSDEFSSKIEVLYSLSYAIRMMPKKGYTPDGYFEYTVYPLEGLWDLSDKGKKSDILLKDELIYTIMIRQPDFVNQDVFDKALEIAKKKGNIFLKDAYLTDLEDGLSVSMLHLGSYDNEKDTFDIMKRYIHDNNLHLNSLVHREIYLSDARRSSPDKLKTILRYRQLD